MNEITIGKARMLNGDCMEFMRDIPDNYYELSICDPPYGIGVSNSSKLSGTSKKEYKIKNWDNAIPDISYFKELKRVSKNQIIWGANYLGLQGGAIVWNKLGTRIGYRKNMPTFSDCEIAYCSLINNVKMFSYTQIGNVYGNDYLVDWNQSRIHPTQKPIALYEWLLTNYAKTGDKILDTHGGSFSSAIACNNLGFEFTGIELDLDYYDAAVKRVKAANQQIRMFA